MIDGLTPLLPIATKFATSVSPQIIRLLGNKIQTELIELSNEIKHAFFNSFSQYISEVYERNSFFSSIVFSNQQKRLKDYYIPLTLIDSGTQSKKITVDAYPGEFITEKKDLLIVDTAGMGKSTLLKYLFLSCVEVNAGIPIFIELRKLSKNKSLLSYITDQLKNLDGKIDTTLVFKLLISGEFIFFLDGYDEISDIDREAVTQDLIELKRRINKNIFIISSREHRSLNTFNDFYKSTIKPLDFTEASNLIIKYSQNKELGHTLIQKLELPENEPIHEFLNNPLLVSLLFKAYEFKHTIPLKKNSFYRQVYEALFENHDLSKELGGFERKRESGLDIYSFELLLRALGFESLQTTKIEYEQAELLNLLEECRKHVPTLSFNPQLFINDLIYRVPLFIRDGTQIRWSHKSLQEYFAALFISTAGTILQEEVLISMYESEKALDYINFLSLYAEIDPKNFRHIFVRAILNDLKLDSEKWDKFENIFTPQQLDLRRGLTCLRNHVFVAMSISDFEKSDAKSVWGRTDADRTLGASIVASKIYKETFLKAEQHSSHIVSRKTIVEFRNSKWNLINQIHNMNAFQELNLSIETAPMTVISEVETNFPYKENLVIALTEKIDCLLNEPQKFDLTNICLSFSSDFVKFNSELITQLLEKINMEIESNSKKKFRF